MYICSRNKRSVCPGGSFGIRAHKLDPYAYPALTALLGTVGLKALREKMIERLGLHQVSALTSMSEGYQAQLAEKRTELETARRRARQTTGDVLAEQFIRDAEELNAAILSLEVEYKDAREKLDNFSAGSAWVDASLERIK